LVGPERVLELVTFWIMADRVGKTGEARCRKPEGGCRIEISPGPSRWKLKMKTPSRLGWKNRDMSAFLNPDPRGFSITKRQNDPIPATQNSPSATPCQGQASGGPFGILNFEFRIPQSEFRNSQVSLTENPRMSVLRPAKGGSIIKKTVALTKYSLQRHKNPANR